MLLECEQKLKRHIIADRLKLYQGALGVSGTLRLTYISNSSLSEYLQHGIRGIFNHTFQHLINHLEIITVE